MRTLQSTSQPTVSRESRRVVDFHHRGFVMSTVYQTVSSYLVIYKRSAVSAWDNLTPQGYAIVLITIAIGGWIMMRSNLK